MKTITIRNRFIKENMYRKVFCILVSLLILTINFVDLNAQTIANGNILEHHIEGALHIQGQGDDELVLKDHYGNRNFWVAPNGTVNVNSIKFNGDGSMLTSFADLNTSAIGNTGIWQGDSIYAMYPGDYLSIGSGLDTSQLDVKGNVSAYRFIGDGSGLTGLNLSAGVWQFPSDSSKTYYLGKVGIGTTGPSAMLQVHSNNMIHPFQVMAESQQVFRINRNGGTSIGSWLTPPAKGLRVEGKIGVGCNPSAQLQVRSFYPTHPLQVMVDNSYAFRINRNGGASVGTWVTPPSNGLYVNGSVGIGVSYPYAKLQVDATSSHAFRVRVNGQTKLWTQSNGGTAIGAYISAPQNGLYVHQKLDIGARSSGSEKLNVTGDAVINGDLSAEKVSASEADIAGAVSLGSLYVINDATVTGNLYANNFPSSSDRRFKKDISPLTNPLQLLASINGVSYYWKEEDFTYKGFNDKKQIGFIAQEVEETLPEIVFTDKYGYLSVDYAKITPVLVEAIKQQQNMINTLQDEVTALRTHIVIEE